jgi:hypothetical protein
MPAQTHGWDGQETEANKLVQHATEMYSSGDTHYGRRNLNQGTGVWLLRNFYMAIIPTYTHTFIELVTIHPFHHPWISPCSIYEHLASDIVSKLDLLSFKVS